MSNRLRIAWPGLGLAAGLLLAPGAVRAQTSCSDSFDGPQLGAAWSFLDLDGKTGGAAALENGKLVLSGRGGDVFNQKNEFVAVRRTDFAGDFDVSVKIESQTNTHEWAQAGIVAANDLSALSKGGYVAADVTPSSAFHLFYDAAGTIGTLDAHADAGKSAYPVWIRLARAGAKFSAWYKTSADASWTVIAQNVSTQGAAAGTPSQVALFSLSHNDNAEAKTVFDDFACAGGSTALAAPGGGRGSGYRWGYGSASVMGWGWVRGRRLHGADGRALGIAPLPPLR